MTPEARKNWSTGRRSKREGEIGGEKKGWEKEKKDRKDGQEKGKN